MKKLLTFINSKYFLIVVLLLAGVLRLWQIGSNPPGLTPDEAALGYNAYSILKTGRDEFGSKLPIIFKSFGDYKPGLYVYLDTPFVALMGLNEVSTRLPSVLAGVLSVFLIYLICNKLFDKKFGIWNLSFGIFAAIVAATNPWLIYFSRGAWEANVSVALTLAGIYFFLRALKNSKFLIPSAILFGLTLIDYQGAKLSTAIVLIILITVYWKEFWKINIKYLVASLLFGVLISIPIISSFFNGQTFRLNIFSIFSYHRPVAQVQALLSEDNEKIGSLSYDIFHTEGLNYVNAILGRYFNNFSGRFLFFEGDWANPISTAPYQGVLLLADIIFLPFGIFLVFKNKLQKGHWIFIFWLIFAPLSAALSRDNLNAVRDLNLAIPMIVFISFGIFETLKWLDGQMAKWLKIFGYVFIGGIYLFSLVYFADALFVHLPVHNSNLWRYGYREAVNYITPLESQYPNIVFEQSFNQPYIYFLFYQKYSPQKWQKEAHLVNSQYVGDVGFETKLDNIQFKQIDWSQLRNAHDTLVVLSPASIPPEIQNDSKDFPVINEIKYLNGHDVAFDIIKIK
jgi:4-amino-4-deoxy-L-arabinose transferase-like glycosyltransferase